MTPEDEYKRDFGLDPLSSKAKRALFLALDIRKFEISLYWQRAAYCWALIAAAFAGYFAILGAEHLEHKDYLAFLVACVGTVFTWAWYLINRGSKFWQENWENHVDILEDPFTGPLYKTVLHRPGRMKGSMLGPLPVSVSQVNLVVSLFTVGVWVILGARLFPNCDHKLCDAWPFILISAAAVAVMSYMYFGCSTSLGTHTPKRRLRETRITDR